MYQSTIPNIGYTPVQLQGLALDTVPKHQPGMILTMTDEHWGPGEFIYAKANGTIRNLGLCVFTPTFNATTRTWDLNATEVPNTANLGRMLGVALVGMTAATWGWFQISGIVPVNCSASVAADTTFGITAAGQGGANSAGKQILNARIVAPGSTTVAKSNCSGTSGSFQIQVPNSNGWFVGAYLSGTGVGTNALITAIDPSGRFVTVNVANSALINGTVTATYNNATIFYNVAHLNRPFAQGAIT